MNLQMISQTQTDTETHLNDSDDNGEFHLGGIGESDLVLCQLPNLKTSSMNNRADRRMQSETDGIETEGVRTARIHLLIDFRSVVRGRIGFQDHGIESIQGCVTEKARAMFTHVSGVRRLTRISLSRLSRRD